MFSSQHWVLPVLCEGVFNSLLKTTLYIVYIAFTSHKLLMDFFISADSDNSRHPTSQRGDVRRRAKSLGALRDARRPSYGTAGPSDGAQVSVIHNRRTDPGLLPLFPYISHIMNSRKSPGDDESTPLYSSYPSVKCDIVEYL